MKSYWTQRFKCFNRSGVNLACQRILKAEDFISLVKDRVRVAACLSV